MPAPAKVDLLPADLREELNRRIVEQSFGGYVDLSGWLAEHGFSIGKSALAVHGNRLARRIEATRLATEQAEALVAATPDDGGALADASLRIIQERLFDLLLAAEEEDLKTLSSAARAFAEASKASIAVREVRRKAKSEIADAVRNEAERASKLPAASVQDIADGFMEALKRVPD